MATIKPIPLGNMAAGVNNRLESEDLAYSTPQGAPATFLQAAENIDLSKSGRAARRDGQTLVMSGAAHSLWHDRFGAFCVLDDTLSALSPSGAGLVSSPVRAEMPRVPVSYSRGADGDVYWTNGVQIRRVARGVDRLIATTPPAITPTATIGAGGLRGGLYLLAVTRLTVDGESPASPVTQLTVPENASITINSSEALQVYLSGPNGDILTLQGAGTTVKIVAHDESARRCMTLNRAVMPPGQIVRHFNGRMLVAAGPILYYSDPYNYGIYNPSAGYLMFPADIDMMEVAENVLYIASNITQKFVGDIAAGLQDCLPYGALRGSSGQSPNDKSVYWQSPLGLIVAGADGNVKNVQEDVLALGDAASGATLYREQNGLQQIITTRHGAQASIAGASSWMEAEFIRKGTVL